jgi:flavin-binding protein dodecin
MLAFAARKAGNRDMAEARTIEVQSVSANSMDDAVQSGLRSCAQTVGNVRGALVERIAVVTGPDGEVREWRVDLRVSFEAG